MKAGKPRHLKHLVLLASEPIVEWFLRVPESRARDLLRTRATCRGSVRRGTSPDRPKRANHAEAQLRANDDAVFASDFSHSFPVAAISEMGKSRWVRWLTKVTPLNHHVHSGHLAVVI